MLTAAHSILMEVSAYNETVVPMITGSLRFKIGLLQMIVWAHEMYFVTVSIFVYVQLSLTHLSLDFL